MTSFSVESILFKDMYSNNNSNTISNTKITKSLDDCVYDAYKSIEDLKFYETYTMINDYNNTQKLRMLNKLRYATNNIKNKQAHNSCESYIRSLEEESNTTENVEKKKNWFIRFFTMIGKAIKRFFSILAEAVMKFINFITGRAKKLKQENQTTSYKNDNIEPFETKQIETKQIETKQIETKQIETKKLDDQRKVEKENKNIEAIKTFIKEEGTINLSDNSKKFFSTVTDDVKYAASYIDDLEKLTINNTKFMDAIKSVKNEKEMEKDEKFRSVYKHLSMDLMKAYDQCTSRFEQMILHLEVKSDGGHLKLPDIIQSFTLRYSNRDIDGTNNDLETMDYSPEKLIQFFKSIASSFGPKDQDKAIDFLVNFIKTNFEVMKKTHERASNLLDKITAIVKENNAETLILIEDMLGNLKFVCNILLKILQQEDKIHMSITRYFGKYYAILIKLES